MTSCGVEMRVDSDGRASIPGVAAHRANAYAKRSVDLVLAAAIGVIVLPLCFAAALGIRLTSPGPVFYVAKRVGRGGRPLAMYKFRTMQVDADRGSAITAPSDSRVFPFGRFLRASKIDELPQLLNVLRGEISFVGPRPEDPRIVADHYDDELRASLELTPGLTSAGTLFYMRNFAGAVQADDAERSYIANIMRPKLRMDMDYARTANAFSDLRLIGATAIFIVKHMMLRLVSGTTHE